MLGQQLWPDLPLAAWSDTCETLWRWTQVAGKVRLKLTPLINHWWNVTRFTSIRVAWSHRQILIPAARSTSSSI